MLAEQNVAMCERTPRKSSDDQSFPIRKFFGFYTLASGDRYLVLSPLANV
jgi:hypothetical protein